MLQRSPTLPRLSDDLLPPLRDWQVDALSTTHRILCDEGKPHLYVSAPTGAGKSRYMSEASESLPIIGERVILVGMNQIVEQHRDAFKSFGCQPLEDAPDCMMFRSPRGHKITITTWQALGRQPSRPISLLCFDECHYGAATDDAKTVRRIIEDFRPTKMISISATTQTANEGILGVKKDHIYRYSYAQAYEDGILNPVDLVEVHTGINADIEQIQDFTGQNMSVLEELNAPNLEKLAQELSSRSVAYGRTSLDVVTTVSKLTRNRHKNMSQIYLSDHVGEQALFFSPNINAAEQATADFNSLARQMGIRVRAEFCHSKINDASDVIRRFKNGEIRVVFVVGMLQEGFDLDTLRLAFDCRFHSEWNASRMARFIQRMGRVMRKSEGKLTSKYYFARDIMHFYNQSALDPSMPMIVEEEFEDDVVSIAANDVGIYGDAGIFGARVLHEMEMGESEDGATVHDQQVDVFESVVTDLEVDDRGFDDEAIMPPGVKKIKLISTPLYVLKRGRGRAIVRTFSVASLFGNSVEKTVEELIALHNSGSKRPSKHNEATKRLGVLFSSYVSKSGKQSNPVRYARLEKECQRWFVDQVEQTILSLIELYDTGADRPNSASNDPEIARLGRAFNRFTREDERKRKPARYHRLAKKCPKWFIDQTEETILALIALHAAGASRLSVLDKDPERKRLARAFSNYISPGPRHNHERYARLAKECPRWFPSKRGQSWLGIQVEDNIRDLIALHATGAGRPSSESKDPETKRLGMLFTSYISKSDKRGNPGRRAHLAQECPRWFVDRVEENIRALIALHVAGVDRPSTTSRDSEIKRLGKAFSVYIHGSNTERRARLARECPRWFE